MRVWHALTPKIVVKRSEQNLSAFNSRIVFLDRMAFYCAVIIIIIIITGSGTKTMFYDPH